MTTKEIREKLAIYTDLPRTNKFKKAVDLALAQNLPLKIMVANPFRGYPAKLKSGKTAHFKVKLKNTNTGEVYFFGRTKTSDDSGMHSAYYRGCTYSSSASVDENFLNDMILRTNPNADLSEVTYHLSGPSSVDSIESNIAWSSFALGISKVCKKDFAHTCPCGKCGGSGFLAHYAHIDNGVCWDCCGSGYSLQMGEETIKQVA